MWSWTKFHITPRIIRNVLWLKRYFWMQLDREYNKSDIPSEFFLIIYSFKSKIFEQFQMKYPLHKKQLRKESNFSVVIILKGNYMKKYRPGSYLNCKFFTLFKRSACPDEYCSITSLTSYGFKASLNFRRATKYLS